MAWYRSCISKNNSILVHIHSTSSANETAEIETPDAKYVKMQGKYRVVTNFNQGKGDNESSTTKGGCFTQIQYTTHQHTGACVCNGQAYARETYQSEDGSTWARWMYCDRCGRFLGTESNNSDAHWPDDWRCGATICNNSPNNSNPVYLRTCDKYRGQIIEE